MPCAASAGIARSGSLVGVTGHGDRVVLGHFGIDETALIGRGGEACVYALDDERVLRVPHVRVEPSVLEDRRRLLDLIGSHALPFATPEVLDHPLIDGRAVVVERRLPGDDALSVLARPGTDRAALVDDHLDVARRVAVVPCPTGCFGEVWGGLAMQRASFAEWSVARLTTSLETAGDRYRHIDPVAVTDSLLAALPDPEPTSPRLVHLDAFLGNMLAEGDRITALLDFGPMTIGGPAELDALVAIAYLASEITPTADDGDRARARAWAADAGLDAAVEPAERWIASYWTAALDDPPLARWCHRVLGRPQRSF